jgi:hypothetical protein
MLKFLTKREVVPEEKIAEMLQSGDPEMVELGTTIFLTQPLQWKQEALTLSKNKWQFYTAVKRVYRENKGRRKDLEADFGKKMLTELISSKIKTFDDILERLGKTYEEVIPWKNPTNKAQRSQNAVAKIQCISEVYNEGHVFNFAESTEKYYLWFVKGASRGGWVLRSVCYSHGAANVGFGFYFLTEELAKDAAEKFLDIFRDYLPE